MTLTRPVSRLSIADRILRALVVGRLSRITGGSLMLSDAVGQERFGDPQADLQVWLNVSNPRFYRQVVFGGGLGAAESLVDGDWQANDLTALVRLFIRNLSVTDQLSTGMATLRGWLARLQHAWRRNTRRGSLQNIRAHYDLGNDFYRLMLDETLSYSCGVFERPQSTLLEASLAKLERVCRKLELRPSDHLLEIGGGWGGLAIYAAERFGCRVTTTTISQEQYNLARQRVRERGLEHRITVLRQDYRDLAGTYDKLVSIEMIEAVGHEYFATFFRKCAELLRPDGLMLLQAIVVKEQRYQHHLRNVDFIRKYIFPGGCLPSVLALGQAAADASDLQLLHLEDLTPHYVRTLAAWRQRFLERLDDVRSQGFSEAFIRMWTYYLCYCEAAFAERQIQNVQLMMAGSRYAGDALARSRFLTGNEVPSLPHLRQECSR